MKRGLTLVEFLIFISIIGIIVAAVFTSLSSRQNWSPKEGEYVIEVVQPVQYARLKNGYQTHIEYTLLFDKQTKQYYLKIDDAIIKLDKVQAEEIKK